VEYLEGYIRDAFTSLIKTPTKTIYRSVQSDIKGAALG
jgi:hypothetical protein